MERCQICGRHPAKSMTFRAHQGFVLFRRVTEISGVFCRDHALEAYFAARGATLKGMWFSPSSLVFGTLRSLYDSAKLLDLPDEVKDEPWVPHIVACPNCRQKIVAAAGPANCEKCKSDFTVASCASCNAVHVMAKAESFADVVFTCRICGRRTRGPEAVRNWAVLLLVRAIAEASAVVATANGVGGAVERGAFLTPVCAVFGLDETTAAYVGAYFDKCTAGKAEGLLQQFREACTGEYKRLVLHVALSVAQADGFVDENETRVLRNLAELLGLDPNRVFEEIDTGTAGNGIGEPWWDVLAVSATRSIDEVTFAYRKLATQFHPDMWVRASESQRQAADARMKRINTAFERAKRDIPAREKRDAAARSAAPKNTATKPTPETREKKPQGDTRAVDPRDAPAAAPAEQEVMGANEAHEEKAVETVSTLPSRPATSRAPNEPATSATSLAFLVLAISAIIAVVGIAFLLNHDGSTHHSLSHVENEATALLPERNPTENVEAASESPALSQGGASVADSNGRSDALDAFHLPARDTTARTRDIQVPSDNDATNFYEQAIAKVQQADYAGAVALWSRAVVLQPNAANLHTNRGIYSLQKAFDDATEAVGLSPESAKAYHNRGCVLLLSGRPDEAISDFSEAIRLDPQNQTAYLNRGYAFRLAGKAELAEADFASARRAYFPNGKESPPRTRRDAVDQGTAILRSNEEYYRKRAAMKPSRNSP